MKPRYAIVRVDKFCPRDLEKNYKLNCIGFLHCDKFKTKKNYGDTKKQLIKKVAQIILKAWFEDKLKPNCEKIPFEISVAKEIVEFLGVK